jgi:hypothetical protein
MKTTKKITRSEYMKNAKELHHTYFLQFATEQTKDFVLSGVSVDYIKAELDSGNVHLNRMKTPRVDSSYGATWWAYAPINETLLSELGESNTTSTHVCVAKACAKMLADNK